MSTAPAAGISTDIPTKAPPPLVLAGDSWQARLVRKVERLHALRKKSVLLVMAGEGPVTFWKVEPDGRCE